MKERGFDREAFFLQKLQNLGITQGLGDDACVFGSSRELAYEGRAQGQWRKASSLKKAANSHIAQVCEGISTREGGELAMAMDSFCEGVHFLREWLSPAECAKKAFLVNASDMIAMGARPTYALLSVGLPRDWGRAEIADFVRGSGEVARELGVRLIGGDTIGSRELQIHITMLGTWRGVGNAHIKYGSVKYAISRGIKYNGTKHSTHSKTHKIYRDKIPSSSLLCFTHSPYPAQSLAKISKELVYLLKNTGKTPHQRNISVKSTPKLISESKSESASQTSPKFISESPFLKSTPPLLSPTPLSPTPKSPRPSPFGRFAAPVLRGAFVYECARFFKGGMDISDGLLSEIRRLCVLNRLRFAPLAPFKNLHAPHLRTLLHAGEAYEMLFALSRRDLALVKKRAARHRIRISVLGTLTRTRGVRLPRARHWH